MVIHFFGMKHKIKKLFVCILILWLAGEAQADLKKSIESIINRPTQRKTQFAINIINADSGENVYSLQANKPLIPASNMKIIASAAALKFLGPEFEYMTQVGLCDNTLVIIGSGDPLLGDAKTDVKNNRKIGWVLDDIAQKVKQLGVKEINDIIVDTTVFDDQLVHPSWPAKDFNKWWAAEVCGLNYNNNCIAMTVENNNSRAVISIEPRTAYVNVINQVKIIKKGSEAVGAYRQPGKQNSLIVKGNCRTKQGPFDVAIERPAGFFGQLLAERLLAAGVIAKGNLIEKAIDSDCRFRKIAEYKTSMQDCLARCNKDSLGLVAEALLKTIATVRQNDKNGSWPAGQRIVSEYLLSLGISQAEFNIDDASGLSGENKLSPNAITKVLRDVYNSSNKDVFKQSLAVGGEDGTISKYFQEDKYKGKIFGKTGYISDVNVRSFSGYCFTQKGTFIFSILTVGRSAKTRGAINDIVKVIFD